MAVYKIRYTPEAQTDQEHVWDGVFEASQGFYSAIFKAYKAFYRINGKNTEVVRVLLARMDCLKVLFGSE